MAGGLLAKAAGVFEAACMVRKLKGMDAGARLAFSSSFRSVWSHASGHSSPGQGALLSQIRVLVLPVSSSPLNSAAEEMHSPLL